MLTDEMLAKLHPDACLFEPRDLLDRAIVDVTDDPQDDLPRRLKICVAVYDFKHLVELFGGDDEALDHVCYNIAGAWIGEGTPAIRYPENLDE